MNLTRQTPAESLNIALNCSLPSKVLEYSLNESYLLNLQYVNKNHTTELSLKKDYKGNHIFCYDIDFHFRNAWA